MNERLSDYLLGELDDAERAAFEASSRATPRSRPRSSGCGRSCPGWNRWTRAAGIRRRRRPCDAAAGAARAARARPRPARVVAPGAVAAPARRGRPRRWSCSPSASAPACCWAAATTAAARGQVVALAPVEPLGGAAHGTATTRRRTGARTSRSRGLQPSADGDFYELWLLNSPDDLVSLGSFRVPASGEVDVSVPLPGNPDDFAALDVSVEPPDGNPAHSSRSVLRAPLKPS